MHIWLDVEIVSNKYSAKREYTITFLAKYLIINKKSLRANHIKQTVF